MRAVWRLRHDVLLELIHIPKARGERADPLGYAQRERKIVETWAKRWHVAAPWLVEWGILTRIAWPPAWHAPPEYWLRERVEYGDDRYGHLDLDVLDYLSTREHEDLPERDPLLDPLATDTIEIDAPNPLLESREEWLRGGTRQLEGAWLEATLDAENRGMVPATVRRALDTHCLWTVRYYIQGLSIRDIAAHAKHQKADQRMTVNTGIRNMVRLLLLPPLHRRGRTRKKGLVRSTSRRPP